MEIDLKTLIQLLFKLVGIYLLATFLMSAPLFYFETPIQGQRLGSYSYAAVTLLVTISLIWFPGTIANGLLRFKGSVMSGVSDALTGFRVGIALVGLYLAITALRNIAFNLIAIEETPQISDHHAAHLLVGWVVQLTCGALCLVRPGFIQALVNLAPHVVRTDLSAERELAEGESPVRQIFSSRV